MLIIANKKIFLLFIVLLFFSITSEAEVIYLKSGKSVEGKILDKDENGNIKLDVAGVPIEYYYNEILGISDKNDGKLVNKMYLLGRKTPSKVVSDYCSAILDNDLESAYRNLSDKKYNLIKNIPLVLKEDKGAGNKGIRSFQVIEEDIAKDKATEKVLFNIDGSKILQLFTLLKEEGGVWKIDSYSNIAPYISTSEKKGLSQLLASASGTVTFPDVSKHGKLTVIFILSDQGTGKNKSYFLNISVDESILKESRELPYTIEHLIPGEYRCYAVWDVNEPFLDVVNSRGVDINLSGDFVAVTGPIYLYFNENLTGIDLVLKKFSETEEYFTK